jgi:hypothetical protein
MSGSEGLSGEQETIRHPQSVNDFGKRRKSREWPARFPRSSASCGAGEWSAERDDCETAAGEPHADDSIVEELLAEFNETLRLHGRTDFLLLERCPRQYRKELLSLCNVAALAYRALAPEREARRKTKTRQ